MSITNQWRPRRSGTMPGHICWSNLEFAQCGALGDAYCIAILLLSQNEYVVAWIWRPVAELSNAERFVEWIYDGRRSDQLLDGDWQPTSPPSIPPARLHVPGETFAWKASY